MKEALIIREVFKKYNLSAPVAEAERSRILRSKRAVLKKIVASGERALFMPALTLGLYNLYRSAGINITLAGAARSGMAAMAASVIIALSVPFLLMQGYLYKAPFIADEMGLQKGFIAAYTGDVKISRGETDIEVSLKGAVEKRDRIAAGESSGLLFRFESGSIVRALSSTTFEVEETGSMIRLALGKGGLLSRHRSSDREIVYEVHTEDASVTVKGTEFGVIIRDGITTVMVEEGSVAVKHKPSGEVYTLQNGEACEVKSSMTARAFDAEEKSLMDRFSELDLTSPVDSMSEAELEGLNEKIKEHEKKPEAAKSVSRLTLEEIKGRYGRIDEVTLYSGRVIRGAIISRGAVVRVLTVNGTVTVQTKDIKGTDIIK